MPSLKEERMWSYDDKEIGRKKYKKLLLLALVMQARYARVKFALILPVCYRNNVDYFKGSSFISIAQPANPSFCRLPLTLFWISISLT